MGRFGQYLCKFLLQTPCSRVLGKYHRKSLAMHCILHSGQSTTGDLLERVSLERVSLERELLERVIVESLERQLLERVSSLLHGRCRS